VLVNRKVEDGITPPSCPLGGELVAITVQEALTEKQTISSLVSQAFVRSLPSTCLCPLSACPAPQVSCVLSLASNWDSKQQILKDPAVLGPSPLFWRRASQHAARHCSAPERQSHVYMSAWSLWEAQQKAATRLSAFYMCLCPLLLNGHSVAPGRTFVLGEAIYTLSKVLQEGECSPCATQGDLHTTVPCANPTLPYILLSLLLSPTLPDLSAKKDPTPGRHCGFSLPQFTSLNLISDTFSPSNCADCFLNLQINFLVVQNDLMPV